MIHDEQFQKQVLFFVTLLPDLYVFFIVMLPRCNMAAVHISVRKV